MDHAGVHVRECAMIVERGMKLRVKRADLIDPYDADIVSLNIEDIAGRACQVRSVTPASDGMYHDVNGACTAIHVSLLDTRRRVWMPITWFESPCMFNGAP